MPTKGRFKTSYKGVFFILGEEAGTGKQERIYYIRYKRNGKLVEEKAGRARQDDMTASKAAALRSLRLRGKEPSNEERRQAEQAAKEAEKTAREAEENKWTINKLWKEYRKQKPDSKGLRTDTNRFENHLKPAFGDKEPHELLQLDVDRVRIKLGKKLKPQTVKHVLNLLDRIVNFGIRKQLCEPLKFKIEKPKVNNLKTEDLTQEQLKKLMEVVDSYEDIQAANMVRLALFSGMRRGELFKLKWKHVNFEKGFISIVDPKGGPDQTIPLNDMARAVLESHPEQGEYVFPGRGGKKRVDAQRPLRDIKKKAELPQDFRILHGLRHVFASMLASSGEVDMYVLQRLLTHKSPQMTMRYAHLRDQTLKRAAGVAGELFSGIMKKEENKVLNLGGQNLEE